MRCPHCKTINRDDRANCYHCGKDLVILRLIINKAKQHYNDAVEKAGENHLYEALGDLNAALELDSSLVDAQVLRGTILARLERFEEARESWEQAIAIDPRIARAHEYVSQVEDVRRTIPMARRAARLLAAGVGLIIVSLLGTGLLLAAYRDPDARSYQQAWVALEEGDLVRAAELAQELADAGRRESVRTAVRSAVGTKLMAAARLAEAGEHRAALGRLREVEHLPLDEALRAEARASRAAIQRDFLRRLDGLVTADRLGPQVIREVHELAEEIRRLLPSLEPDTRLAEARLASRLQGQVEAELGPLVALLDDPANGARIEAGFLRWAVFEDDRSPLVGELLEASGYWDYKSRWISAMKKWAREAAERGDHNGWEEQVARLELHGEQEDAARAREYADVVRGRQRELAREALEQAVAEGDPRTIVRAARSYESRGGSPMGPLRREIARAAELLAIDGYYALMEQAGRIEAMELSEEEAREVLLLVRDAEGPLPPRLRSRAEENIRFFALQAARVLGRSGMAREEYMRLQSVSPQSPYLALLARQGFSPDE